LYFTSSVGTSVTQYATITPGFIGFTRSFDQVDQFFSFGSPPLQGSGISIGASPGANKITFTSSNCLRCIRFFLLDQSK